MSAPLSQRLAAQHQQRQQQHHKKLTELEPACITDLSTILNRLGIGPVTHIGIGPGEEGDNAPMRQRPYALALVDGAYLFGYLPGPVMGYALHVLDEQGVWQPVDCITALLDVLPPGYVPHRSVHTRTIRPPLTQTTG